MALRQAERLAQAVQADDVVAIACGNQANVAMIRHRYEQALTLAERAVALHQQYPPGHGLAVALGTLGQIAIRLGQLSRAAEALNAALAVRTPLLYHETTGAIFDSLAQIHLIRGDYDACADALAQARDAFGVYDAHTPRWYDWSLRLIDARLTSRRGDFAGAVALADAIAASPGVPPADEVHAYLDRRRRARSGRTARRGAAASRPHGRPRGPAHDTGRLGRVPPRARCGGLGDGPRHRGLSRPVAERDGVRPARRTLSVGAEPAGARPRRRARRRALAGRADAGPGRRDLPRPRAPRATRATSRRPARCSISPAPASSSAHPPTPTTPSSGGSSTRRRLPELLATRDVRGAARNRRRPTRWWCGARRTRRATRGGARRMRPGVCARAGARGRPEPGSWATSRGPGRAARARWPRPRAWPPSPCRAPPGYLVERRLRMVGAVARQGFELCEVRERPARAADVGGDRTSAGAAHSRVPLRGGRDGAGRRPDQAAADHGADGAHHRGKRHGQGTGGAGHPRRLAALGGHVPAVQLHDHDTGTRRQPVVRASSRQLHRRADRPARAGPHVGRGHAVSRRDRRPAHRRATQAAAVPGAGRDHAAWRDAARSRWTCASSPPPTPTSSNASAKGGSARTCSTG